VVRDQNCTVDGQDLCFTCTFGGVVYVVKVEVADAHSRVEAYLNVRVQEVNDAPVIEGISPKMFIEDEAKTIDLSLYMSDEDNSLQELSLECDHPAVVEITGFNMTMNYMTSVPEHIVEIAVFDGLARGNGNFSVQVQPINDLPVILGLGDLQPPILIELDEGTTRWLQILVEDEDDTAFTYSMETIWGDIETYPNGTMKVVAVKGEVATYTATLVVRDNNGGEARETITVRTLNVNDPPTALLILKPANHTLYEVGSAIPFDVSFSDPDIEHGQELTITWSSNISSVLMVRGTGEVQEFSLNDLEIGLHRITVTVDDGEFRLVRWIELEVFELVPPPTKDDEPSFFASPAGLGLLAVVILAVLGVAFLLVIRSRKLDEEPSEVPPEEIPVVADVEGVDPSMQGLADLSEELGKMATTLEAVKDSEDEWEEEATTEPEVREEPAQPPPLEVLAEREHTKEVREVMKILTQLPRGLPTALWGREMAELARDIVDGETKTVEDGTPLALINGRWYIVDVENVGTFLREWKDEKKGAPELDGDERAKKLAQLEELLLEGKISEETYERLRKKYEGDD
jgi:hypothetical protein